MAITPVIDTSGIGQAFTAVIEVAERIEMRAEDARVSKANLDYIKAESSIARSVKQEFADKPELWATEYEKRMSDFSSQYSGGFKFKDTQENFINSVGQATAQKKAKLYEEADKQIGDNWKFKTTNSFMSAETPEELNALSSTILNDPEAYNVLGGEAQVGTFVLTQKVSRAEAMYKNVMVENPYEAERLYQGLIDGSDAADKAVLQDSLVDVRDNALKAISQDNMLNVKAVAIPTASEISSNPEKSVAKIQDIANRVRNGEFDRKDGPTYGNTWMSEYDQERLLSDLDSKISAISNGLDPEKISQGTLDMYKSQVLSILKRWDLDSNAQKAALNELFASSIPILGDKAGSLKLFIEQNEFSDDILKGAKPIVESALDKSNATINALIAGLPDDRKSEASSTWRNAMSAQFTTVTRAMLAKNVPVAEIEATLKSMAKPFIAAMYPNKKDELFGIGGYKNPADAVSDMLRSKSGGSVEYNLANIGKTSDDASELAASRILASGILLDPSLGAGSDIVSAHVSVATAYIDTVIKKIGGNVTYTPLQFQSVDSKSDTITYVTQWTDNKGMIKKAYITPIKDGGFNIETSQVVNKQETKRTPVTFGKTGATGKLQISKDSNKVDVLENK